MTTAPTNFEFEIDDYVFCDACDYGFFVVTAFILAVITHALGVGLKCPGGPPGGSLAVAAVEGHRKCRVVLRVAGARRDDLWPFFGRDRGWLRRLRHALHPVASC